MRIVDTFDPATETSETFNGGFSSGQGRIVVYNESNCNLQLGWDTFTTYCPAWTAMLYCISANSVNINWQVQSQLAANGSPISQVVVEAYDNGETITGTFPAPLVRQTNIGNAGAVMSSSTNIINDGLIAGTQMLESTVIGDTSSAVSLSNDGNLILGDTAHPGSLTMLGAATVARLLLSHGSLSRISVFGGTGVVNTAAHGLGVTPNLIIPVYHGNFGVVPGHPIYYFGENSTTVTVVADTGYSWLAVAIAF